MIFWINNFLLVFSVSMVSYLSYLYLEVLVFFLYVFRNGVGSRELYCFCFLFMGEVLRKKC